MQLKYDLTFNKFVSFLFKYTETFVYFNDAIDWMVLLSPSGDLGIGLVQGGRSWQPFVGGKNGHKNFRQTRIYNFRDKCIVFARNRKLANLTR